MSTQPGYTDSDADPRVDEDPTLVHDQPTSQWAPPRTPSGAAGDERAAAVPADGEEPTTTLGPTAPPVAPPPDLEAAGNAKAGLLTAAASDRCTNCGAQLAPDQRYCVVCGERRGRQRFASAMFGPQAAPVTDTTLVPVETLEPVARFSRFPPAATLIAGVAVLLVAMGLGILIGHDSANNKTIAPQPKVNVTVNGGGGSGTSTGASTTSGSTKKSSTSKTSTKATKTTAAPPPISAAQQQKSAAAASKVLGTSSHNTPPPTVQPGQACTHGAGCQHGKFTGNFFGG